MLQEFLIKKNLYEEKSKTDIHEFRSAFSIQTLLKFERDKCSKKWKNMDPQIQILNPKLN